VFFSTKITLQVTDIGTCYHTVHNGTSQPFMIPVFAATNITSIHEKANIALSIIFNVTYCSEKSQESIFHNVIIHGVSTEVGNYSIDLVFFIILITVEKLEVNWQIS